MVIEQFFKKLCGIRTSNRGSLIVLANQQYIDFVYPIGLGKGYQIILTDHVTDNNLDSIIYYLLHYKMMSQYASFTDHITCRTVGGNIREIADVILRDDIVHIIIRN